MRESSTGRHPAWVPTSFSQPSVLGPSSLSLLLSVSFSPRHPISPSSGSPVISHIPSTVSHLWATTPCGLQSSRAAPCSLPREYTHTYAPRPRPSLPPWPLCMNTGSDGVLSLLGGLSSPADQHCHFPPAPARSNEARGIESWSQPLVPGPERSGPRVYQARGNDVPFQCPPAGSPASQRARP